MTEFRFVHSSDLHLGRRFGRLPEEVRGPLAEARHTALARLAAAARAHGAAHVLLAGDTFDTPTPSDRVLRQALNAMAEAAGVSWWLLPGNHDSAAGAEPLWERIAAEAPANVHPVREAAPVNLAPGVTLLPAPVTRPAPGRDLTSALDAMESPEGALRIGLAHGGVVDFAETGASIPPDRDRRAGLDYLALGDWHGRLSVSARTQYPGTPEQDRFRHGRRGVCLAVTLPGPGAAPVIEEVETGVFLWREERLPLVPGTDPEAQLAALLPASGRREMLLRLSAEGRARLAERAALARAAAAAAPDFWHFDLIADALATEPDAADLDAIDQAGALRRAADALAAEAADETLDATARRTAAAALARLYAYVVEGAA
ncbi:exonuclease SbcCD subunit D [Rhodosalinus sp. FB01]|uniref:metallophosphoesterase family protein n=1 Tax=Rhodosalinus sp. FB01 TaxID=3239194 RepID=UPI0035232097